MALVTGAASGIGRATAQLLAAGGAAIVVADILEVRGLETVQLIEEAGGKAAFARADVTNREQVEAMVQAKDKGPVVVDPAGSRSFSAT